MIGFVPPKIAAKMAKVYWNSCLTNQIFARVAVIDTVPVGIMMGKNKGCTTIIEKLQEENEMEHLQVKRMTTDTKDFSHIKELYELSFPQNERRPFEDMLLDKSGSIENLVFYENNKFCGFACLINTQDISHIIYLAIENDFRNKGYGSQVLALIHEQKEGKRIIVDIEQLNANAINNEQRKKRKQFYLRNGYEETEVKYCWENENYEILSYGGTITGKEFEAFWRQLPLYIRRNY